MTDDSYEELFSIKIHRLKIFLFFNCFIFFCVIACFFLVLNTSLKEFVPGKESEEIQKEVISLSLKSDSLINSLENQKNYFQNFKSIITGEKLHNSATSPSVKNIDPDFSFEKSIEDSLLRVMVENKETGMLNNKNELKNELFIFFSPIKGIVSDTFNLKTKHFGIDLVAKENSRVSSVLDGVVIISDWNPETGYVIGVQHKSGFFSLYKHNSILLKTVGDFVSAGEHVAIIGNTGEFSSGPHLHFELWLEGVAVNPENYILF